MKELSLFTGAGGGVLGSKLLGWEAVGYVEWDKYCQEVLAKRIEDGFLDEAPIFGDIDEFIKSGAAKKYEGFVDVVTAGFPCQPFSVAGKKRGQDDERNKWPQTLECIRLIRPRYALLENVPGLLNSGYFGEILSSLAQSGFDARWIVLGADDVGAPHRRKRLWIKATSQDPERSGCLHREHEEGRIQVREQREPGSRGGERVSGDLPDVADSDHSGSGTSERSSDRNREKRGQGWQEQSLSQSRRLGEDVADSSRSRFQARSGDRMGTEHGSRGNEGQSASAGGKAVVADSESIRMERSRAAWEQEPSVPARQELPRRDGTGGRGTYWSTEPNVGRVAHGVASRVDRLKALGNGQVPLVAATAWLLLTK